MGKELERHGRVKPNYGLLYSPRRGKTAEKTFEHLIPVRMLIQARSHDMHARLRAYSNAYVRLSRIEYRFFNEKYAPRSGEPAHQVLRTLKYKIPSQVREANQIGLI